jgi:hypothetical protein
VAIETREEYERGIGVETNGYVQRQGPSQFDPATDSSERIRGQQNATPKDGSLIDIAPISRRNQPNILPHTNAIRYGVQLASIVEDHIDKLGGE